MRTMKKVLEFVIAWVGAATRGIDPGAGAMRSNVRMLGAWAGLVAAIVGVVGVLAVLLVAVDWVMYQSVEDRQTLLAVAGVAAAVGAVPLLARIFARRPGPKLRAAAFAPRLNPAGRPAGEPDAHCVGAGSKL